MWVKSNLIRSFFNLFLSFMPHYYSFNILTSKQIDLHPLGHSLTSIHSFGEKSILLFISCHVYPCMRIKKYPSKTHNKFNCLLFYGRQKIYFIILTLVVTLFDMFINLFFLVSVFLFRYIRCASISGEYK